MQNNPLSDAPALPNLYRQSVLSFPALMVALLVLTLCFFAWQTRKFALDASADALLLENDVDLQTYRASLQRYGTSDFLVVTFDPNEDLFSNTALDRLAMVRDELTGVDSVESVSSLLDVPLLTSSGVSLSELTADVPTLTTHRDIDLAKVCLLYTSDAADE